ncbi:sulfatase [SAR202 cluster bacterium AC-647-N09_OGT_505m]|nr:sulfatase [SAR202 cluster bacterium AC-647-N09_OGT_505m]
MPTSMEKRMNVIWIVADTFRRDHIGAYGNPTIRTPSLDALAAKSVRFDGHYAGGFPTMPARADHATGRWTMSFMGWEALPESVTTLAEILASQGFHTAASVDTPFYMRDGMNYDRGFQSFFMNDGQDTMGNLPSEEGYHHEFLDVMDAGLYESDLRIVDISPNENHRSPHAPRTFTNAIRWLKRHHKEDFFLLIDTWDPHEPWDAPSYYTQIYWPEYSGELILPLYGDWHDVPGYAEDRIAKGHATYCGEITMVDTWIGFLLKAVENMGLTENTAVIFTTDHGFYFGEHGGLFGKMVGDKRPDGTLRPYGDPGSKWAHSPLYEELVHIPLLVHMPGVNPGAYPHLTSVVDVMPTVLDMLGIEIPSFVDGRSLLPALRDTSLPGREFVVSTMPFANPGDSVHVVDTILRVLGSPPITTITADGWSLLYSTEAGISELYNLTSDPLQLENMIAHKPDVAKELHQYLVRFMRETGLPDPLLQPRLELRL